MGRHANAVPWSRAMGVYASSNSNFSFHSNQGASWKKLRNIASPSRFLSFRGHRAGGAEGEVRGGRRTHFKS